MTALPDPRLRLAPLLHRMRTDAAAFSGLGLFIALTAIPLLAAAAIDPRDLVNAPIWQKPLQFHLALAVYLFTLAFFARYLPTGLTRTQAWRIYTAAVCAAILAELLWVGGAATFGVASHFNTETPIMAAIYGVMGGFAVLLTSASLVMGIAIWRNTSTGLPPALHLSIGLGLILTFLLTLIAAGTLSSMAGHHIGTPITGASLPILGWSREVGDLRVAHFLASHALHILPTVGLLATRALAPAAALRTVWAASAAFTGLIGLTMAQALSGQPFLPWLG